MEGSFMLWYYAFQGELASSRQKADRELGGGSFMAGYEGCWVVLQSSIGPVEPLLCCYSYQPVF